MNNWEQMTNRIQNGTRRIEMLQESMNCRGIDRSDESMNERIYDSIRNENVWISEHVKMSMNTTISLSLFKQNPSNRMGIMHNLNRKKQKKRTQTHTKQKHKNDVNLCKRFPSKSTINIHEYRSVPIDMLRCVQKLTLHQNTCMTTNNTNTHKWSNRPPQAHWEITH